jgi:hypothetical protein
MTVREPFFCPLAADLLSDRLISPSSLCGGPRVQEGRRADQVIRNHAEADPPGSAVGAAVATAS